MSTHIRSVVRPDGRCLVRPHGTWTVAAVADAVSLANELQLPAVTYLDGDAIDEQAVLVDAGFATSRQQALVVIDLERALDALAGADLPAGVDIRSAADVDEDLLRLLDDELRQDVPGTSGWRSSRAEFRAHTFQDSAFDPGTYLVAVDRVSGDYVGLVRIWMNPQGPRLGMLGVRREHRRRGIACGLLRRALAAVRAAGATEIGTEFDTTNAASRALAERLGARRIGTRIEFLHKPNLGRTSMLAAGPERSHAG